ncbi:uncharacterized protein (TIGR00369 family) [Caldalkalibacillus uzonensis]|uniref:Uncharacterized protein (TIGR00369 family) n=1 Tax=Caldalkalibacillus uzonensis TaxID=353224 RepID=A0ABU0CNV4_9BACI|nr:PaaI family thioesterase [Caldalkalibacillus uzonensis]MDQ0338095.1 uncharacterized protein (TIGR00369 family) [Caldalkalibacillus uzonensis]
MDYEMAKQRFEKALAEHQPDFEQFFLAKFFDLQFSYGEETCRVDVQVADYMFNPQGSLHGGVISFILDVAMGHLCKKFLGPAVTLEMKINFLKPVFRENIYCESRFIKKGKTVVVLEARMFNADDAPVAVATSTWHRL